MPPGTSENIVEYLDECNVLSLSRDNILPEIILSPEAVYGEILMALPPQLQEFIKKGSITATLLKEPRYGHSEN